MSFLLLRKMAVHAAKRCKRIQANSESQTTLCVAVAWLGINIGVTFSSVILYLLRCFVLLFYYYFFTSVSGISTLKDGRASQCCGTLSKIHQLFGPNFGRFILFYFSPTLDRVSTLCMTHVNPVTSVFVNKRGILNIFFLFRRKKPLWSRLSPAFNDVKPCLFRVCKSVSLVKKKKKEMTQILGRVNICQHWGT